jgi:hypothetical protein
VHVFGRSRNVHRRSDPHNLPISVRGYGVPNSGADNAPPAALKNLSCRNAFLAGR